MVDETNVNYLTYSTFFNGDKFNRNKIKESWIKKHYFIEHSNIEKFCQDNNIRTDIFSQKVYHYIFKLDQIPTCRKCHSKNQRYLGFNIGYNPFCSKKCSSSSSSKKGYETRIKNTIKKYGVSHTTQLESVREKMELTNMKRFGVRHPAQNIDILDKMRKTNKEKYGSEFPLQNKEISDRLKEKIRIFNPRNTEEVLSKMKNNSLNKYGVEWSIQSVEVKNKIKDSTKLSIISRIKEVYKDNKEIEFIEYEDGVSLFNCLSCNQNFYITSNLLYQRYIKHEITVCTHCNKLNNRISNGHLEICDYLKEIGIKYEINVRSIISPYEIDIYLPDHKIGIEFNGVYWHSEIIKTKNYHFQKRKDCLLKDIDLIQVWEDDWRIKKDIIKSVISSRLGKSQVVKWARKLEIRRISNENILKEFLSINHLQGWCLSSIKYGLFEGSDLISIMTFSKNRINVNNKDWEIVRFCNKLNHTVLGSFGRLMKKFISDQDPKKIISYSDNDAFSGKSYENNKMTKSTETLNYWWCDGRIRHNRWKFRKDVLVTQGNDPLLSGTQIMINNGYFRCWGSGTTKWELLIS